jgi:glycosyltransferase involved in cell wall biosynthesis
MGARRNLVTIITIWPRSNDLLDIPPGVQRIGLDQPPESLNVIHGTAHATARTRALRRAFREIGPDAVVSFLHRTNEIALLASSGLGIPVFVSERSDPRHDPSSRGWMLLRRVLYPFAAGVVVQTNSVARWARSFCRRVHVIPNFVERPPHRARVDAAGGPRKVLAMGRLSSKGVRSLIDAFARIAPRFPEWELTIFGEAQSEVASRHEQRRPASGRVRMPGRTPDPWRELAAGHVFARLRARDSPMPLLEAMACGLPAVAFDCPSGPAEIITHQQDGILVPAGDVRGFADALTQVLGSVAERSRLGTNATQITARFSPDTILERWAAMLGGVPRRGARSS